MQAVWLRLPPRAPTVPQISMLLNSLLTQSQAAQGSAGFPRHHHIWSSLRQAGLRVDGRHVGRLAVLVPGGLPPHIHARQDHVEHLRAPTGTPALSMAARSKMRLHLHAAALGEPSSLHTDLDIDMLALLKKLSDTACCKAMCGAAQRAPACRSRAGSA